jgi:hypothetical protein
MFNFSEKEPLHSCFPSQDKVSTIDHVIYPMGKREPLLPPIGLRDCDFPLEYDLTICGSSCPSTCESLLIDSVL